ncbi:MAG: YtxH domain-containing protein [Candidatus Dormibacteraeota bacterium]|nr:YtxH domain-containing protein [Candidatus Dormibacteraeota bacterium]MBV9524514.1 YtxH domain-containing protein [Candidatus Dormibacteraeota bacterium]
MGYVRGFVHGAVAGTVIGLCAAPQTGDRTRAQLREGMKAVREGAEVTARALSRVAPVANTAVQAVERVRHRSESSTATVHGNGSLGAGRPG